MLAAVLGISSLVIFALIVVFLTITEITAPPPTCVEEAVVKEILSVQYRHATFLLTDGRQVTLSQATLKPGDTFCMRWKQ